MGLLFQTDLRLSSSSFLFTMHLLWRHLSTTGTFPKLRCPQTLLHLKHFDLGYGKMKKQISASTHITGVNIRFFRLSSFSHAHIVSPSCPPPSGSRLSEAVALRQSSHMLRCLPDGTEDSTCQDLRGCQVRPGLFLLRDQKLVFRLESCF